MHRSLKPGFSLGGVLSHTLPPSLAPHGVTANHFSEEERWMFVSLLESMQGVGTTNPNPAVGCILVKEGKEIGRGHTEEFRKRHAERVAFDTLKNRDILKGATAYVTLEPCSHQGNQPPCLDLFLGSGIARVVISTTDPNPKVNGQAIQKLKKSGIRVDVGVLRNELIAWHSPFLAYHLLKRPIWIGKWAETQDGILADDAGKSQWITGPAARAYGHWLRQKYDAILVGAGTVLHDHPQLTARECRVPLYRQPLRLIFDPKGMLTEISENLQRTTFSPDAKTVLFYKGGASPKNLMRSTHLIPLCSDNPIEEVKNWLVKEGETIFGKPIQSVFVEGGTKLLNSLLRGPGFDLIHRFTAKKSPLQGTKHRIHFPDVEKQYFLIGENLLEEDSLKEYFSNSLVRLLPL